METQLLTAFKEFVEDLKNVTRQPLHSSYNHDEIKNEFEKTKNIDINSLQVFDIPVGKIYQCSGSNSKQAIEKHLELLRRLSTEEKEESSMLPIGDILNSTNLEKIASLVNMHKGNSDSPVDILRKVVNSQEFEEVAADLTKNFSGSCIK